MSLVDGSVSVNGSGVASGTGFARDLYDALVLPLGRLLDVDGEPTAGTVEYLQLLASTANALAGAINDQVKTSTITVNGVTAGGASVVAVVT